MTRTCAAKCRKRAVAIGLIGLISADILTGAQTAIPGPAGIFVIGNIQPVANESDKYNLDYVSGLTLPIAWRDMETLAADGVTPVYDFSRIDTKLEEQRARGKLVTLQIFVSKVPDRVLAMPDTVTWNNPHPTQGGVQVVPWDANGLAAYQQLITAMANHVVAGTSWRIADHPALQSVDAPIVGLQSLREVSSTLVAQPSYTRQTFVDAVVQSVSISRTAFTGKFGFLGLFAMSDADGDVAADAYARLMAEFNVSGKPSLGFFQETLTDLGPSAQGVGTLLSDAATKTYVMLQALRPWQSTGTLPAENASGTPITGLNLEWTNFQSVYVELYGQDVLAPANVSPLRTWSHFMLAVNSVRNGQQLLAMDRNTSGGLQVHWTSDPLLNYQLWQSTNLSAWSTVTTPSPINGEVVVPVPPATTPQFYRLELLHP